MKKNMLYKVMMMVLMAVVTMTFAACGGDDADDNNPNPANNETNTPTANGEFKFIVPYTEWNATPDQVKETMTKIDFTLYNEESGIYQFINSNETMMFAYVYVGSKIRSVQVHYYYASEKDWQTLLTNVKNTYGVVLNREDDGDDDNNILMTGFATVNSRECLFMVYKITYDGYTQMIMAISPEY